MVYDPIVSFLRKQKRGGTEVLSYTLLRFVIACANKPKKQRAFIIQNQKYRYSNLPHTRWEEGRVSGAVYHHNKILSDLAALAYRKFSSANPLHPEVFPGVRKMEAEVCAMVSEMFHAGPKAGAVMTSGGTESILMSCKAHREWGKDVKGITEPEM